MRSIIVPTGLLVATLLVTESNVAGQGQPPPVEWERVYGGLDLDLPKVMKRTSDGGFYLAGESKSDNSGTKTSPTFGGGDFWVIRLDANGHQLWDRTFGGTEWESPASVEVTADGGCLVGGYSDSPISGNKTISSEGGDYWIVRLNDQGEKLWERSFGGNNRDFLYSMDSTPGGGFVLAGDSQSGTSADKSMTNFGSTDLWIVWLDSQGNRLRDRCYGGTNYDVSPFIISTSDGGYIVGANSYSGPSGNKTSPHYGEGDLWVLRLDATWDIIWDRTFGGLGPEYAPTLAATRDEGCALLCTTRSDMGGNKASVAYGGEDYWVVRLDRLGNLLWEKTFGGTGFDFATDIQETWDGGFLVGGASLSSPSGNKTSPYFGAYDAWILRLDALGNELWQHTLGGFSGELEPHFLQASDGAYIVACRSHSGVSGNRTVPGFSPAPDYGDIWMVKLRPDSVNLRSVSSPADVLANDGYRFLLSGPTNTYIVEASSNLFAWQAVQTNQLETNSMVIHDSTASPGDRRFYRASVLAQE